MEKISLIENSYTFVNEAILNSRKAKLDVKYLSFSILHLIQGLELMLKHLLNKEHPILIYENIDKPKNTVSLKQALERLINISNVDIEPNEIKIINRAISQRNKIVHHEYELNPYQQYSIFIQLFEFIHYFHKKHFKIELHDFIDKKLWRRESELLSDFKQEWIEYRGQKVPNYFPLEIVLSQKYTAVRQKIGSGYKFYARNVFGINNEFPEHDTCDDCGANRGEYHLDMCDIERCPICHGALMMCIISDRGCNLDYWILKRKDELDII
ncbi:MAG: hypothetical protein COA66_10330 [Arcobacter sp.]|nr:MAG: hypothetical protein COA66_10330 [Arcobacter sp.]